MYDRNGGLEHVVRLPAIPTHDDVLRAMIVATNIGGISLHAANQKYAVVFHDLSPYTRISILTKASGVLSWRLERRGPVMSSRKPNPLGPIFAQGWSRPDEELYRWNVLQPDGSWTHVFLPKYPSHAEIAVALGRDPREVVSFHKYQSGNERGVEFDDLSFYKLNRVW